MTIVLYEASITLSQQRADAPFEDVGINGFLSSLQGEYKGACVFSGLE